jgi:hypothetical protein
VQWPFANFLMSAAARNWFFGTAYMDYGTRATSPYAQFLFIAREATPAQFGQRLLLATVVSMLMMWIGIHAGLAMRRVRR